MAIFSLTIGIAGFFFCTAFHSWVDQRLPHLGKAASRILQSVKAAFSANPSEPDDHLLIARLIAQIRAGISLDSALEALGGSPELSKEARRKIGLLLDGRPHFDSLSVFLAGALRS